MDNMTPTVLYSKILTSKAAMELDEMKKTLKGMKMGEAGRVEF